MTNTLYDNAMQVVPLLLVALFVEARSLDDRSKSPRARWWKRFQDRVITILGIVAFITSTFVVADVIDPGPITIGVVVAGICGSIGLLFGQIWLRFDRSQRESDKPPAEGEDSTT